MNPRVIGGRYAVLGELGRGGMGVVWRAEDRVMGRHVAVKELHLPEGLPPVERRQFRERLLREARNAGRLNDPGIVTVHDVVHDAGVDHIVMELIEARTLTDVVAADGPLPEHVVVDVATRLLAALRTAHERGIVHRDVKPGNVMLGANGRVTLTDFGIAQAVDDPRLTTTGSLIGSPGYMAPERLEGTPASPTSDLWALGGTLFHALVGHGPFSRETTAATVSAVLTADPPPVHTRGPLGAVVSGLLQRAPQARLTGMQAEALLRSDGRGGAPATVTTPLAGATSATRLDPDRDGTPTPRRPRWKVSAVLLGAGLVAGVVAGLLLPGAIAGTAPVVLSYGDGGDLPVFEISSPTCLQGQLVAGRQFAYGASTSCTAPHDLELYETFDPFGSQRDLAYPGLDEFAGYARSACGVVFDSAVLTGQSGLEMAALVPSERAFGFRETPTSSFGERDVLCLVRSKDGAQLTGSALAPDPG
ncbi:MAG: serine/threonine protein kinase [Pseudonocardia sp.]|nr:serine/threonine protein kinase [Pseudonocardia sp.]